MSMYEAMSLMIAFAILVLAIANGQKKPANFCQEFFKVLLYNKYFGQKT